MHRFFIPEHCIAGSTVIITGKPVHQLRNVLRLRAGDRITVLDNSGWEYDVELGAMNSSKVEGVIVRKSLAAGEPRTRINLYQALLKASNFEMVLQKCTEVGVTAFVPLLCERCVAGEPDSKRLARWQNIIREAAEQSRRGRLPILHQVVNFPEACRAAGTISLLPWEGETVVSIGEALSSRPKTDEAPRINIFIGPEGGFSSKEVELARGCRIVPVSLGRRILRADTAGLVAASITLYEFGDLKSS
jgi:16S rRNA (uracil1498-N3)-methyltransferase